jgi:hypothetical protein
MNLENYVTRCGAPFRVLATDLPGDTKHVILVNEKDVVNLDESLKEATGDEDYDLLERPTECTRYFNIYRAADGCFCFGSKAWADNEARQQANDTARAIAAIKITMNGAGRLIESAQVPTRRG